jgi:phosphate transport system protein
VITKDAELDKMHEEMEYKCLSLLALQAPVAGELRIIVSAIRVVFELARMGDLAVHVAKIARLRYPNPALPAGYEDSFKEMADIAAEIVKLARTSLRDRNAEDALRLVEIDERMDVLRHAQFTQLLAPGSEVSTEGAIDVALLGRYYERFADHAVAVGRRVIYIMTGEVPEGEDWPNA